MKKNLIRSTPWIFHETIAVEQYLDVTIKSSNQVFIQGRQSPIHEHPNFARFAK